MSRQDRLPWGILGCGNIAGLFASALPHSRTGRLAAVASRSADKAQAFAREHGAERSHGSYEALLEDPEVEAVYIATPHPMHAEWVVRCAEAGKHILCEKPMTLNAAEATATLEHVRRHDVFFMEAFMYRCHPQTRMLVDLLRDGAVGQVKLIVASFGYNWPFDAENRVYSNDLGGGGILDVGCYPVSMSRLIAGTALGTGVAEPLEVHGTGVKASTGVDTCAGATLRFESGIVAQLSTAVTANLDNRVQIFGSEGRLVVEAPWLCDSFEGGRSDIRLIPDRGEPRTVVVETDQWLYGIEADVVAAHRDDRQAPHPAMSWDDTIGNMRALDRWRARVGVVYERERAVADPPPEGTTL